VFPAVNIAFVNTSASNVHFGRCGITLVRAMTFVAFFFFQQFCVSQYVGPLSGIQTDFSKGRNLSTEEAKAVIKLANQGGVTNIAKVSTYYRHPTSELGINVSGAEVITGRFVSFVTVHIFTERLAGELANPTNVMASEGEFWVRRGFGVQTNTLAVLHVRDRTVRVRVGEKVTLEQADRLVAAFAERKIRYKVTPGNVGRPDFSRPESLRVGKDGSIWVTYSCGDWCSVSFECVLEKAEVVVIDTASIIS
jgi:hypothetical protein